MARYNFSWRSKPLLVSVSILIIIIVSFTFTSFTPHLFTLRTESYKHPSIYWTIDGRTIYDDSMWFKDITNDGIPELIACDRHRTISVYDITTKTLLKKIIIKNSTYLNIFGIDYYLSPTPELLLYSSFINATSAFLIIDLISEKITWELFQNSSNEGVADLFFTTPLSTTVYYNKDYKSLTIIGVHTTPRSISFYIYSINLNSKKREWTVYIPGYIQAATLITKKTNLFLSSYTETFLIIWSRVNETYTGINSYETFMLYCIDLKNGSLLWKSGPFKYTNDVFPVEVTTMSFLSKHYKRDINGDGFKDLIIADSNFLYVINGYNGSSIRRIPFSGALSIALDDFDNNGQLELVALSQYGTLATFSPLSGEKLWEIKLSLTILDYPGTMYVVPTGITNQKRVLILRNETYTLIDPVKGKVILNKSIPDEFSEFKSANYSVGVKCPNLGPVLGFSWSKPIAADLNNDGQNEIILGVYSSIFTFYCPVYGSCLLYTSPSPRD